MTPTRYYTNDRWEFIENPTDWAVTTPWEQRLGMFERNSYLVSKQLAANATEAKEVVQARLIAAQLCGEPSNRAFGWLGCERRTLTGRYPA